MLDTHNLGPQWVLLSRFVTLDNIESSVHLYMNIAKVSWGEPKNPPVLVVGDFIILL